MSILKINDLQAAQTEGYISELTETEMTVCGGLFNNSFNGNPFLNGSGNDNLNGSGNGNLNGNDTQVQGIGGQVQDLLKNFGINL